MERDGRRPDAGRADRGAGQRGIGVGVRDRRRGAARQRPRQADRPDDLRQGLGADRHAAVRWAGAQAHDLALLHALRRVDPRARHRARRRAAGPPAVVLGGEGPAGRRDAEIRAALAWLKTGNAALAIARPRRHRDETRPRPARGGLRGTRGRHHHRRAAPRRHRRRRRLARRQPGRRLPRHPHRRRHAARRARRAGIRHDRDAGRHAGRRAPEEGPAGRRADPAPAAAGQAGGGDLRGADGAGGRGRRSTAGARPAIPDS